MNLSNCPAPLNRTTSYRWSYTLTQQQGVNNCTSRAERSFSFFYSQLPAVIIYLFVLPIIVRNHSLIFSIRGRGVCISNVESQKLRKYFSTVFSRTLYLFTQRQASFGHSPVSRCLLYRKECRVTLIRRNAYALPSLLSMAGVRATTPREFRRIFWYLAEKFCNVINARPARRLKFLGKLLGPIRRIAGKRIFVFW